MRHTDEQFDAAIKKFIALGVGNVHVTDWPNEQPPYQYGEIEWTIDSSAAPEVARDLAAVAVEVRGYLTMNVYDTGRVNVRVAVSRDLKDRQREGGEREEAA